MNEKRIGDQKEKFLVARMTERQKKIAQYKAHKTNQTVDALVIEAVSQLDEQSFWKDHHCPSCGKEKRQEEISFYYRHHEKEIHVRPYYKMICAFEDNKNDFFCGKLFRRSSCVGSPTTGKRRERDSCRIIVRPVINDGVI